MTDEERNIQLADILMSYADNTIAVRKVLEMNGSKETTPKDYIIALADGLLYGNWPWINYSKQIEGRIHRQKVDDTLHEIMQGKSEQLEQFARDNNVKFLSREKFISKWTEPVIFCDKCESFECHHVKSLKQKSLDKGCER